MPEAPNAVPPGWVHPQQQGFPAMDQQQGVGLNQPQSNHIFVMNNVKPEQSIPRREEAITSPPPPSPSVITATYNPTYNRCLPKILSDLDCEMKIKQVLRCIENILLENGDVDLQQQAYKLPDRSSSPQFAKSSTKKPKFKEDEEMLLSPNGPAINLPLATNSPASLINKASASKNPIKINVKVEPEAEKAAQHGVRPPFPEPQSLPNGSPRAQMFDFSYKQHQSPAPQGFPQQAHVGQPQRFGFDNSYSSPSPSHPPHPAQPMIPHIQLSMSSPHLTAPSATSSPHLHHLHASSPHIHNSHVNSPHLAHSPLAHANSPHLVHSPHPHSPLVASQASPHLPAASPHLPSASPLTQFQVITNPNPHPEPAAHSDSMMSDFQYPPLFDGVQAGGHPAPQKKEHNMQDYVLDPALFAQYLAQNQQQLQQLQQQLQQQQQQHNQLQQQQRLQQHAPSPAQSTSSTTPAAPSSAAAQPTPSTQAPAASASANASAPAAAATTSTTTAHQQPPVPINAPLHLFDTAHHPLAGSAHPITLSGHMSFSGHLLNQIGPDGIRLEEDDKWILSLLNMDSNIAHDLSLSGHIPPL